MKNKNIIKVNKNQKPSNQIPKTILKKSTTTNSNIAKNKLNTKNINNIKNKNNIEFKNNQKKVTYNITPTSKITKPSNHQKIISMQNTPYNNLKYKDFIKHYTKDISNTEQIIEDKRKTLIPRLPNTKIANKIPSAKKPTVSRLQSINIIKNNKIQNKIEMPIERKIATPQKEMNKLSFLKNDNNNEKKKNIYTKKILSKFLSKKSREKISEEIIDPKLISLSTYEKMVILQNLLKEMTSIKQRFQGNKEKMIEKMYSICYNYFKGKVYMKEIFDYCINNKPEEHCDYQLILNTNDYLDKNLYKILYDFFFLIRNDNKLMLSIIKLGENYIYEDLSDFIVNFFYENIINSSFAQEELLLMIYIISEDLFLKAIPKNADLNNKNIYLSYINNSILYYIFKSLTRKIDVRNFLSSILNDIILRMESFRYPLSLDISKANRFLTNKSSNFHHSFIKFAKGENNNLIVKKPKKQLKKRFKDYIPSNIGTSGGGNVFLKRANKIELGKSRDIEGSWVFVNNKFNQSKSLNDSSLKNSKYYINNDLNKEDSKNILNKSRTSINKEDENINFTKNDEKDSGRNSSFEKNEEKDLFISENINIDENLKIEKEFQLEVEIDPFFENNSVTLEFLNNKQTELRKSLNKNNINYAMKEYIQSLITQFENEDKIDNNINNNINNKNNNLIYVKKISNYSSNKSEAINDDEINEKEIFSTSEIIKQLKSIRKIKQEHSFKELMKKLIMNYKIVTKLILNIIKNLKDNLIYIPILLKYISKIVNTLLVKLYKSSKKYKYSFYNLYIFKLNFLIGNFLLPIISNPEYNGLVTNNIISTITSENLQIISNIFEKALSGQLFTRKNAPYMALFNPFIIEIMPILFELVESEEKNLKLPYKIQLLIKEFDSNNMDRNINYDFFQENPKEKVQYQSICFSWPNLYIFLLIIIKSRNIFIDNNKNKEQKEIFKKIFQNQDKFIEFFSNGKKNKKNEFFILTKINYKDEFSQKLSKILKDDFVTVIPKFNDDLITAYKKCLTEVLCYANIIHKKNIKPFTFRKDEVIFDNNIIKMINKYKRKNLYENIINREKDSKDNINDNAILKIDLKKMPLELNDKEEADFRFAILPQLLDNIKDEISFNLDNPTSQRIIFCCNYLKLYIRNIPNEYKINNYNLLFSELIQETRNNIEYLNINILFEYFLKLKEAEKTNLLLSNYHLQIRNLEKIKCIEYLYYKLKFPFKLNITKDQKGIITNIEYNKNQKEKKKNEDLDESLNFDDYLETIDQPIFKFIDNFPDFIEYEEEFDNILDIEEKANAPGTINDYFNEIKIIMKKEKILNRFNKEEKESIIYDLENYILTRLYEKIFPLDSTKDDIFFYKKCVRLSFIKPENVVKDKKMINESLMEKAIDYLNDIDDKLTPVDKIKSFAKAIEIVQNSIYFSTGKNELGVDDIIKPLIYIMIKARPKNICSNFQFCELYLNSELGKVQFGVILTQISMIIQIVKNLKYDELIGVTEKEFGVDEIEDEENEGD